MYILANLYRSRNNNPQVDFLSRRAPRLFLSFSSEAEVTSSTPRGNSRECLRSSNRRATAWRTRSVRRPVRCRARSTSSRRLTRATTLRRSRSARRSEQCSWPSTTAPTLPLCRYECSNVSNSQRSANITVIVDLESVRHASCVPTWQRDAYSCQGSG